MVLGEGFNTSYFYFHPNQKVAMRQYLKHASNVGEWRVEHGELCFDFGVNDRGCVPSRLAEGTLVFGQNYTILQKGDRYSLVDDIEEGNPYSDLAKQGLLYKYRISAANKCLDDPSVTHTAFEDRLEGAGIFDCAEYRVYAKQLEKDCEGSGDRNNCVARMLLTPRSDKGIDSKTQSTFYK